MPSDKMNLESLKKKLEAFGQSHLLDHWEDLSASEQDSLYNDLDSIPYTEMADIFQRTMHPQQEVKGDSAPTVSKMEPVSEDLCASVVNANLDDLKSYQDTSLEAISKGQVGVLLLAGKSQLLHFLYP